MTDEQWAKTKAQIVEICNDIIETVDASPNGVPCETLFMALKHVYPQMTRWQFDYTLIDTLVEAGKVKVVGACLYTPSHVHIMLDVASKTKQ